MRSWDDAWERLLLGVDVEPEDFKAAMKLADEMTDKKRVMRAVGDLLPRVPPEAVVVLRRRYLAYKTKLDGAPKAGVSLVPGEFRESFLLLNQVEKLQRERNKLDSERDVIDGKIREIDAELDKYKPNPRLDQESQGGGVLFQGLDR